MYYFPNPLHATHPSLHTLALLNLHCSLPACLLPESLEMWTVSDGAGIPRYATRCCLPSSDHPSCTWLSTEATSCRSSGTWQSAPTNRPGSKFDQVLCYKLVKTTTVLPREKTLRVAAYIRAFLSTYKRCLNKMRFILGEYRYWEF